MLRRLFFGLGVILGLVSPETGPAIAARVWREAEVVRLNLELTGAFEGSALELAAQGTEVAWRLEASVSGPGGTETARLSRSLRFEGASQSWVVRLEPEGEEKRLRDREAALVLASRAWGLRIASLPEPGRGLDLRIAVFPGIIDAAGGWHDAGLLWAYAEPRLDLSFASPTEIPR